MGQDNPDRAETARQLERLRAMHQETTDPLAARLLGEVLSEMEAALAPEKSDGRAQ